VPSEVFSALKLPKIAGEGEFNPSHASHEVEMHNTFQPYFASRDNTLQHVLQQPINDQTESIEAPMDSRRPTLDKQK